MQRALLACVLTLAAASAHAQAPAPAPAAAPAPRPTPPPAPYGAPVTLEQARRVIAAAEAEARRRGWTLSFAVVEPSGELVHFARMDGAGYGSIGVSQAKARTAARFGRPTRVWGERLAAGRLGALGIEEVLPIEGGVPLVVNGRTIGAIGVSGASAADDGIAAEAGVAALR